MNSQQTKLAVDAAVRGAAANATAAGATAAGATAATPMNWRIFSWNVNGLRAVLRKGALQEFLAAEQPDILCLQEIKMQPGQVELDLPDYQEFWHSAQRPGYAGTAILSKIPPLHTFLNFDALTRPEADQLYAAPHSTSARADAAPNEADADSTRADAAPSTAGTKPTATSAAPSALTFAQRWHALQDDGYGNLLSEGRILTAEFTDFYLVTVYTPNAKPDLSRLNLREQLWDPAFCEYLQLLARHKPVLTCGDFNAAHTEIDLARPKQNRTHAGFTDAERQGVTNLLAAGFIDTFRQLHPEAQRYTWWSHWGQARAHNVGWRIDYFFLSNAARSALQDAEIYEAQMGSDHCPISVTLNWAKSTETQSVADKQATRNKAKAGDQATPDQETPDQATPGQETSGQAKSSNQTPPDGAEVA